MTSLYLLIPLSLLLLALAVWAFFWAVNNDQFDDLDGPAHRILFDDDLAEPPKRRPAKTPAERDEPRP
ncbi:cbb3-type cytochrome oxidase assembly protein CcoS [Halomonas sp. HMF6819]|uniref:cbb3-type cytochrome oxidase assembly protein CcoS n=1 Tax=Halomonas sp. HMF6819 TaxID=3373085 RepID=UPI0037A7DBE4